MFSATFRSNSASGSIEGCARTMYRLAGRLLGSLCGLNARRHPVLPSNRNARRPWLLRPRQSPTSGRIDRPPEHQFRHAAQVDCRSAVEKTRTAIIKRTSQPQSACSSARTALLCLWALVFCLPSAAWSTAGGSGSSIATQPPLDRRRRAGSRCPQPPPLTRARRSRRRPSAPSPPAPSGGCRLRACHSERVSAESPAHLLVERHHVDRVRQSTRLELPCKVRDDVPAPAALAPSTAVA